MYILNTASMANIHRNHTCFNWFTQLYHGNHLFFNGFTPIGAEEPKCTSNPSPPTGHGPPSPPCGVAGWGAGCVNIHAFACTCTHMHAYASICMHMHAYACIRMHMHAYACICMHMHTYACICMHMRACACKSMYIHAASPPPSHTTWGGGGTMTSGGGGVRCAFRFLGPNWCKSIEKQMISMVKLCKSVETRMISMYIRHACCIQYIHVNMWSLDELDFQRVHVKTVFT